MVTKHVYKIELEDSAATPAQAAKIAVERLTQDGRKVTLVKDGTNPVLSVDGTSYHLSVAPENGALPPCAVLKEQ